MHKLVSLKLIFLSALIGGTFNSPALSQKKNEKLYKDGYIIRFSDTIPCKVFAGFNDEEIGYEVTFHYGDGKPVTYHPGGVVKGFGIIRGDDTIHYYQIPVPEYWINEQRNNKAYAEVVSHGQLTLYKFTKIKNTSFVIPIIAGPVIGFMISIKKLNYYFLKIGNKDSLFTIGNKNAIGPEYFERKEIMEYVIDRPQVLANIPPDKFVYIKELITILNEYNSWYQRKINDNSSQCP
jgi:hypothetical protein